MDGEEPAGTFLTNFRFPGEVGSVALGGVEGAAGVSSAFGSGINSAGVAGTNDASRAAHSPSIHGSTLSSKLGRVARRGNSTYPVASSALPLS